MYSYLGGLSKGPWAHRFGDCIVEELGFTVAGLECMVARHMGRQNWSFEA